MPESDTTGLRGDRSGTNVAAMDTIDTATAEVVRDAIRDAGQNGKSIAGLIGMPYSTWRRKIHGHSSFAIVELKRIARLIGLRVSDLVRAAEDAEERAQKGRAA